MGIALAYGGLLIAFFGRSQPSVATPGNMLLGDLLGLMGGMACATTTMMVRCSRLSIAPTTQTLLYQLVCAFVLLLAVALSTSLAHFNPIPRVWAALVFHTLVVSFASFLV